MRALVTTAVAVTVLTGVALSGCESTAKGTPVPQSDASRPSEESGAPPTTEADRLAPSVEDPKNLRGIDPCQLFTPEQLVELTFTNPGEKDVSVGGEEGCIWQNSNISVGLSPDTRRDGLEETYRREQNFDNFEESSVDGYPAVRVNFATQICSVVIGVADDQTLSVDFGRVSSQAPGLNDPCGFAEKIAGMVLDNLPSA